MLSVKEIEYFENFRSKIDNKFHYVYKITNLQNNYYYFGVHNTANINDGYMGSGVLITRAQKKIGLSNFAKEFLKFFETTNEAFEYESQLVTKNIIDQPECYNLALGGIKGIGSVNGHSKGRIHVNNGVVEKMIYPHDKQEYINNGWIIGCICRPSRRKIYVNKNGHDIRIWPEELQEYLDNGWQKSSISNTGKIHINNGISHKMVSKEELQEYLDNGWQKGKLGKTTKGLIWIKRKNESKQVSKEELQEYLDNGWVTGRYGKTIDKKVIINKNNKDI